MIYSLEAQPYYPRKNQGVFGAIGFLLLTMEVLRKMNMYSGSFSKADTESEAGEAFDKRILREEYRNYDLVARYWEYGYLGKIWKNRKAVEELDAEGDEGLDELMVRMRAMVDSLIAEKTKARKNRAPANAELLEGFQDIAEKLTALEKLLLKHHAEVEGGEARLEYLQRLLNLTNADSLLEIYSRIGQKLNDEIGYNPRASKGQKPALKLLLDEPSAKTKLKLNESVQLIVLGMGW